MDATYARILRDDRHLEIKRLSYKTVAKRLFPGWAMHDDPARSWMWSQAEAADGAVAQANQQRILNIFERLAAEPVEDRSRFA